MMDLHGYDLAFQREFNCGLNIKDPMVIKFVLTKISTFSWKQTLNSLKLKIGCIKLRVGYADNHELINKSRD